MPRPNFRYAALPAALLLMGLAQIVHAQTTYYFPNDTTIDYAVNGYVCVGYASPNDLHNKTNGTSPTVNLISGSSVHYSLDAYNNSTINISGGDVGGALGTADNSVINVSGGNVAGGAFTQNTSTINISGGNISDMYIYSGSTINIKGGSIGDFLAAYDNSTLNLFGTGLGDTLINSDVYDGYYSQYALFGVLSDGTNINGESLYIRNRDQVKINFINAVPEPGSIALLVGLASVGLLVRKRHVKRAPAKKNM